MTADVRTPLIGLCWARSCFTTTARRGDLGRKAIPLADRVQHVVVWGDLCVSTFSICRADRCMVLLPVLMPLIAVHACTCSSLNLKLWRCCKGIRMHKLMRGCGCYACIAVCAHLHHVRAATLVKCRLALMWHSLCTAAMAACIDAAIVCCTSSRS